MLSGMDAPSDLGSPGAAPTPDPPSEEPRRLRRRPEDGHIAGVCAGVAEYFDVDPVLVRIAAVVLLFTGPGFFAYVLAWIFVPAEPGPARFGQPQPPIDRKDRATQIFGIVLLGLGVSVIWGDWWSPLRGWLFPLGLMALGAWLLFRPDRDDDRPWLPPVPPVPVPPAPPSPRTAAWSGPAAAATEPVVPDQSRVPAGVPDGATVEEAGDDGPVLTPSDDVEGPEASDPDDTTDVSDPTDVQPTIEAGTGGTGWGAPPPPTAPWDMPPPPVPGGAAPARQPDVGPRHGRRHLVGPGIVGVLLIWTGIAWLTGVGLTTGLAVGLVILGVGFVIGSFVGGSRALILPALLVAIALLVTAFVDIPFSGPIGEQHWSPDSRTELEAVDTYDVSMGEGTLDLSELPLLRREANVRATVGLGHLIVLVPEDQDVTVNTEVGAGEVLVFGERQNGVGFETHDGYPGDGETLVLDLEVGMGQIEVHRVASADSGDAPDPVLPRTEG